MTSLENQYLQEMGISRWQLMHPKRMEGYHMELISLPLQCKLLFVSAQKPEGELAEMFERVLKSMKLSNEQALHIYPEQLAQLGDHQLTWIWFSGCDIEEMDNVNTLQSPLLIDIQGNNQQRRALWQQICTYL